MPFYFKSNLDPGRMLRWSGPKIDDLLIRKGYTERGKEGEDMKRYAQSGRGLGLNGFANQVGVGWIVTLISAGKRYLGG